MTHQLNVVNIFRFLWSFRRLYIYILDFCFLLVLILLYISFSYLFVLLFSDLDVSHFVKIALIEAIRDKEFELFSEIFEKVIKLMSNCLNDENLSFFISGQILCVTHHFVCNNETFNFGYKNFPINSIFTP